MTRITLNKFLLVGALIAASSFGVSAQKLRSVSAHANMHSDLIASQRDINERKSTSTPKGGTANLSILMAVWLCLMA